ncbi:hypothetical protein B0H13DRAFT_1977297 [Mycena leptocephala]|nr:hypothetical protein B0H13DRAFT_1977297 [Mycena leptocephala]
MSRHDVRTNTVTNHTPSEGPLVELSSHFHSMERICADLVRERDGLLEALKDAKIQGQKEVQSLIALLIRSQEFPSQAMRAEKMIADLHSQAAYWKEQAATWRTAYTRTEQGLVALSRSVKLESPAKHHHSSPPKSDSDQSFPITPTKPTGPTSGNRASLRASEAQTQISSRRVHTVVVRVKSEDEESGDELAIKDDQEIYGGIHPSPKSAGKRPVMDVGDANTPSPSKRCRTSTAHSEGSSS